MGRDARDVSELGRAAMELDAALREYQQLVGAATRQGLDPERGLSRATRAATEAQECQARLGPLMTALSAALNAAWTANQEASEQLRKRVEEIARREVEINALVARFGKLGDEAGEISTAIQAFGAAMPPSSEEQKRSLLVQLSAIDTRMEALVDAAKELASTARAAGMDELPRHIDSLRQQVHAARNRVGFLTRQLLDGAPPLVH